MTSLKAPLLTIFIIFSFVISSVDCNVTTTTSTSTPSTSTLSTSIPSVSTPSTSTPSTTTPSTPALATSTKEVIGNTFPQESTASSRASTFPYVVDCSVTLDDCNETKHILTDEWHITCYLESGTAKLCSSICNRNPYSTRCGFNCPEYTQTCLKDMTTPTPPSTLSSEAPGFPLVPRCDVPRDLCEQFQGNKTAVWNASCIVNDGQVRSCYSLCMSEREGRQLLCSHKCQGYKSRCMNQTTTTEVPTTHRPPTKDEFPYAVQCDVTIDLCRLYKNNLTRAYNTTCFLVFVDGLWQPRLCKSICLSKNNTGEIIRCREQCKYYLPVCGQGTSEPVTNSSETTSSGSGQLSPGVIAIIAVATILGAAIIGTAVAVAVYCFRCKPLHDNNIDNQSSGSDTSGITMQTFRSYTALSQSSSVASLLRRESRSLSSVPSVSESVSPPMSPPPAQTLSSPVENGAFFFSAVDEPIRSRSTSEGVTEANSNIDYKTQVSNGRS